METHEKFLRFLSYIVAATSQCSLYSREHPAVAEFSAKAMNLLDEFFTDDTISITRLGENLLLNDVPVMEKGIHMGNFMRRMKKRGIDKIILKKGINAEELTNFIAYMVSKDEVPLNSDHLSVGTVHVRLRSSGEEASEIMNAQISKIKGIYQEFSRFKSLETVGLEDAILGFILALKKEANVLHIVSPIKSYSEYTYVHAANVSVLTLFQSESLGMQGEDLREAGLAGLLHDIGKLLVSKEVLDKQGKLDEDEWKEMKRHPVYGAMYLSSLPDPPKLAVIAAFEHHLKFDGTGYPDTKWRTRKQHILSQIIAVSDFFDALRAERPYRKGIGTDELVGLLQKGVGKDFNPMLIDNLIGSLKQIRALQL